MCQQMAGTTPSRPLTAATHIHVILGRSYCPTQQSDLERMLDTQKRSVHLRLRSRPRSLQVLGHGQHDVDLSPFLTQAESVPSETEVALRSILAQEARAGLEPLERALFCSEEGGVCLGSPGRDQGVGR
jgi:hypothetical protein